MVVDFLLSWKQLELQVDVRGQRLPCMEMQAWILMGEYFSLWVQLEKKKSLFVYDNFSKLTQVLILKLLFVLAEVN